MSPDSLATTTSQDWDRVLTVNLTGCFDVLKSAVPHMTRPGSVIQIASMIRPGCARPLRSLRRRPFGDPRGSGTLLWRSCQPRIRLASVFADADAAQRVLDAHGEDGYLRRWVAHPFPADELRELRSLV
ncbi:SDR family oxidoreductase [Catenulispora rubra]|uniref:SDR family oxidoreductase n=1 Tax=Catenulispora rubra TaxID=280293 RepID=UPI0018922B06|nr:SDR family oxidoreductase [Catenulispora rubra]